MSDEFTVEKRGKRIRGKEHAIRKQTAIAKAYGLEIKEPHRYEKHHLLNCGNPKCIMCGNPRKVWKELTLQERRSNDIMRESLEVENGERN